MKNKQKLWNSPICMPIAVYIRTSTVILLNIQCQNITCKGSSPDLRWSNCLYRAETEGDRNRGGPRRERVQKSGSSTQIEQDSLHEDFLLLERPLRSPWKAPKMLRSALPRQPSPKPAINLTLRIHWQATLSAAREKHFSWKRTRKENEHFTDFCLVSHKQEKNRGHDAICDAAHKHRWIRPRLSLQAYLLLFRLGCACPWFTS